ncbi:MAG: hypothetical protein LBV68_04075 [Spirochaetaceae bacterium]|jgi:hypothetical protein|nr:hypothetical protein [Spirochaetaceae bacterium]
MFINSPNAVNSMPKEYRKTAEALFPPDSPKTPSLDAVKSYAQCLEIETDFNRLLDSQVLFMQFFAHFKTNLSLLIAKTWVEKSDEARKEILQGRLPAFYAKIEQGDYRGALYDFSAILEELAYLFFGEQSKREDFTEYAFRIDTKMGLFWWYGSRLSFLAPDANNDILRAILILGISYLAGF